MRILCTGIQFAVRKGSCAALSKLHIRFCLQLSRFPELLHAASSFFHRSASLQHKRHLPRPRQYQRRKKPGRAAAYNDRPFLRSRIFSDIIAVRLHHRGVFWKPRQYSVDLGIDRDRKVNFIFPARVDRTSVNPYAAHGFTPNMQRRTDACDQILLPVIQRQRNILNSNQLFSRLSC